MGKNPGVAPLSVDPEALSGAGSAVAAAGDALAAALSSLTTGFSANTGQDAAGEVFGLAYQDAAESLVKAAGAGINALRHNGAKIQLSASNYSAAEAASTLGGGAGVLPAPSEPAQFTAPGAPGTLGSGVLAPALWSVVEAFVGDLWPNGDVAGLHAAAGHWRDFAAALNGVQGALNSPKSVVAGQDIPEGAQIQQVLSAIGSDLAGVGAQCQKLAGALDDFADEVADTQDAIRDLLDRFGSVSGLWNQVMAIFEGDALDEIKEIAEDIQAVLSNLGRQARAQQQLMQQGMQAIDGLVVGMQRYVRGQLTQFLGQDVGNPLATVFDTYTNTQEGVFKAAVGMVEGIEQLNPQRFLIDPQGAAETWKAMTKTGLINHLLNPEEAVAADKEMVKGLLHLEDWRRDRPGLGFGGNLFDVATLFVPGAGGAGAGAKGAAGAARAAEVGGEAADAAAAVGRGGRLAGEVGDLAGAGRTLGDIGKTGRGLTEDLANLGGDLPKADPPVGGRPVALPPPKPAGAPAEPTPRPVESVPPGKPALEAPSGAPGSVVPGRSEPAFGPHDPASAPVAGSHPAATAVTPGERVSPVTPHVGEPARAPGVPVGAAAGPVPAGAHSAPAAIPAAPGAHVMTGAGRPAELSAPHGGVPQGLGDAGPSGGHPHGLPPHGGGPHGPGDASHGARHAEPPRDGTAHGTADGGDAHGDDVSGHGLSAEKRDEIIAMPKGSRPDPSEYLSPEYIQGHLDRFTDGATRFMPESNLDKYGIAQRDGTSFVMPKSEADAMIAGTGGDLRLMEEELGLPEGFLDSNQIVRIDIEDPRQFNLRIPSGNEAGANEQWIPGGRLPTGASEAVVDGGKIPQGDYTVTDVFEEK